MPTSPSQMTSYDLELKLDDHEHISGSLTIIMVNNHVNLDYVPSTHQEDNVSRDCLLIDISNHSHSSYTQLHMSTNKGRTTTQAFEVDPMYTLYCKWQVICSLLNMQYGSSRTIASGTSDRMAILKAPLAATSNTENVGKSKTVTLKALS